jgi:2',3'-cyclic-nucleotide 2'-phosphodiesterase
MKILFIGDIFGRRGREAVQELLPVIKQEEGIHLTIANCENASHGRGPTVETIKELLSSGIDFFTSGNHIWDVKVLRPANYPTGNPGRGHAIVPTKLLKNVLVINLQGRVFMPEGVDSPFQKIDEILALYKNDPGISAIFVDFHAEATSEKHAMRHYLNGRVSVLVGTHTHVQTNDAYTSAKGTAFISDVGMTGVFWNSVIGLNPESSLELFLKGTIAHWEVAKGEAILQGVVVEVDDQTKRAVSIKTIQKSTKS